MKNKTQNKRLRLDFQAVVFACVILSLLALVIYPFLTLILKSFAVTNLDFSAATLDNYKKTLSDPGFLSASKNTLIISLATSCVALLRACISSWLVVRSDFKYKHLIKKNAFYTFVIPSYVLGISYLELFCNGGYLHHLADKLGIDYGLSPYGMFGVILVLSIHLYPMCFYAISNAMGKVDRSLEDSACIAGASRLKAALTITFPLLIPTIFSIGLFVFSRTMANFGVAAILLMPSGKQVLSTSIYRSLTMLDLNLLAAQSVVLVIASILIFAAQSWYMKKKSYVTVDMRASKPRIIKLRNQKIIAALVFIVEFASCILPLIVIFSSSLLKRWGLEYTLDNLTLQNYADLLGNPHTLRAFRNSLVYGFSASILACLIASATVHLANLKGKHLGFLEALASWPMSFPNIVMAVGAILCWSVYPVNFYGSPTIIIITYTTLYLPIAIKHISGSMKNLDTTLVDAARVSGASAGVAWKDIVLVHLMPALKSAVVLCMVIAFREIPISMMLHTGKTETVGVLLFNMKSNSAGLEATSTLAAVVILLSLVGRIILKKLKKASDGHAM